MSITSTINIDGVGQTIVLSIFSNGTTLVDAVTYTASTQLITFPTTNNFIVSSTDFLQMITLYISLNTVFNSTSFVTNKNIMTPVQNINVSMNDDGVSTFEWIYNQGNHSLFDFTCTYPNGNVAIAKRNQTGSLTFCGWLCLINGLQYYNALVHSVYKK